MGEVLFNEKGSDKELLLRNHILISELERTLKPEKGNLILVQSVGFGFQIGIGEFYIFTQVEEKEKNEGCLYFKGDCLNTHLNGGDLTTYEGKNECIPTGYNGEIGRIVNQKRKIIYEDVDVMEAWKESFSEWKSQFSPLSHYKETRMVSNLLFPWGISV